VAYLDVLKDAVCSCTYPRCFQGQLRSHYEIMSAMGGSIEKELIKTDAGNVHVRGVAALEKRLKNCCASKTEQFLNYAKDKCGAVQLQNLCRTANGYEGRFDGGERGATLHFPKSTCITQAWSKFETLRIVDKDTFVKEENFFSGLALNIRKNQAALCRDEDDKMRKESHNVLKTCAAAEGSCMDATHGEMVRKNCPETCNAPHCAAFFALQGKGNNNGNNKGKPRALKKEQLDVELDDALADTLDTRQRAWTFTPTMEAWTHSPTEDQSCFVDPDMFDCSCLETMKRNCRNEHYRKGIASGTYKNGLSLTECYEFLVCTHSQTCSSYKKMHCQHQLSLLKTLQKRNIKVETC